MKRIPTLLALLTTLALLSALPAMAAQAPAKAQPATATATATPTCTAAPTPAFLSDIVPTQPATTASAWVAGVKFHGFCPCGCSFVPDCNTSADCFGGATCRTAPSCC
jgi:hypothetical protein